MSVRCRTLAEVKSAVLRDRDFRRVNVMCVVGQFLKTLCRTNKGKYTMIIEAVDISLPADSKFVIHFFTKEETLLKQVSQGDVLRLTSLKMELTPEQLDCDGRIFCSTDIVLFKQKSQVPICLVPSLAEAIGGPEKVTANKLKFWFNTKFLPSLFSGVVTLAEIKGTGQVKVFGKIVVEPYTGEAGDLRIRLTDGFVIENLHPTFSLGEGDAQLTTEISIKGENFAYNPIKVNDFILFTSVVVGEAVDGDGKWSLSIENNKRFYLMSADNNKSTEIERRIQAIQPEDKEGKPEEVTSDATSKENVESSNLPVQNTDVQQQPVNPQANPPTEPTSSQQQVNPPTEPTSSQQQVNPPMEPTSSQQQVNPPTKPTSSQQQVNPPTKKKTPQQQDNPPTEPTSSQQQVNPPTKPTSSQQQVNPPTKKKTPQQQDNPPTEPTSSQQQVNPPTRKKTPQQQDNPPTEPTSSQQQVNPPTRKKAPQQQANPPTEPTSSQQQVNPPTKPTSSQQQVNPPTRKKAPQQQANPPTEPTSSQQQVNPPTRKKAPQQQTNPPMEPTSSQQQVNPPTEPTSSQQQVNPPTRKKAPQQQTNLSSQLQQSKDLPPVDILLKIIQESKRPETKGVKRSVETICAKCGTKKIRLEKLEDSVNEKSKNHLDESVVGDDEESRRDEVKQLVMRGQNILSVLKSTEKCYQIELFLENINPSPTDDQFSLVKGFCRNGCQNFISYSEIEWSNQNIQPSCPICEEKGKQCALEPMFLFHFDMFDKEGICCLVLLLQEQAEKFLGCSVEDYLRVPAKRAACVRLLNRLMSRKHNRTNLTVAFLIVNTLSLFACLVECLLLAGCSVEDYLRVPAKRAACVRLLNRLMSRKHNWTKLTVAFLIVNTLVCLINTKVVS